MIYICIGVLMATCTLNVHVCRVNSIYGKEMKVYYVTQVFKQGITYKRCALTTYSNLESRAWFYGKSIDAHRPS